MNHLNYTLFEEYKLLDKLLFCDKYNIANCISIYVSL